MNKNEYVSNQEEQPVISIIQEIKQGILNPKTLSQEVRQRCVDFLMLEGFTEEQIAQLLMRTERTIRRDVKELKKQNSLSADISLAKEVIGDVFRKAMVHHKYLMRLARSSEASVSEKSQSEFLAWRVLKEMVEKLQSLSYLPKVADKIIGDFSHHVFQDDEKSIDDLKMELIEVEKLAMERGGFTPELEIEVKKLKKRIEQVEIEKDISKITDQQRKDDKND